MSFDANALIKSMEFVHKNLDEFKIKEKVDKMSINGYINYCAGLAAGTGAAAGIGGGATMLVGVPVDLANTVAQQFRVTLGVIYHRTGRYKVSFPEFMKIVGLSVGIELGVKGHKCSAEVPEFTAIQCRPLTSAVNSCSNAVTCSPWMRCPLRSTSTTELISSSLSRGEADRSINGC